MKNSENQKSYFKTFRTIKNLFYVTNTVLRNSSIKNPLFESIKIEIESKIDEDENEDVFELTNYERITARAFTLT